MALRCLIVDDNEEFLVSAGRLLGVQGIEIVGAARTGGEAVALAGRLAPDVALVDVQLADEDGLEVARTIEELVPSTRVVLVSTHSRDDLADLPPNDLASSPLADELRDLGAVRADVTGAGPVVYALFADRDAAGRARAALEGRAAALWLAEPA